jgi:type IV pilus assembly protein PilW
MAQFHEHSAHFRVSFMEPRIHFPRLQRSKGFGLIELLVGMAIGLITVVVIMQVLGIAEGFKRTTTTGSDAQTNGIMALRTLESEIRMAGYGLTRAGSLACPRIRTWYNPSCSGGSTPFGYLDVESPVLITDGGSTGASDTIQVNYSSSDLGYAPMTIVNIPSGSSNVTKMVSTAGLKECQKVVYASNDGTQDCTMLQITNIAGNNVNFTTASGQNNSCYNPAGGLMDTAFGPSQTPPLPVIDFASYKVLLNMGDWVIRQYSVTKTSSKDEFFLHRKDLSTPANDGCAVAGEDTTPPDLDLYSNIVNIQAQYGVAPANSQTVDCWTNAVANPSNVPAHCQVDWTPAGMTPANAKRIKAVRIAIVVRSALSERPSAGTTCDTTTTAPVAWNTPSATLNPAPTISLSTGTNAVPNWQCYRYKVYQSVVPLINVLWSNS